MARLSEWRVAYAKQARADLRAREKLLEHMGLPACQQLHFLQMACEKVCKAYLCGQGTNPEKLRTSHAFIAGPLPVIVREQFARERRQRQTDRSWVIEAVRTLARKIELLAPAVDAGGTHPANCEYPWLAPDGLVSVPAEHNFGINLLYEPAGAFLIKALQTAMDDLELPGRDGIHGG